MTILLLMLLLVSLIIKKINNYLPENVWEPIFSMNFEFENVTFCISGGNYPDKIRNITFYGYYSHNDYRYCYYYT